MSTHVEQPTEPINEAALVEKLLLVTCLSEGSSGYWDDCGPCANTCVGRINHLLPPDEYNGATIAAIRTRDIQAGRFTAGGGQTLDDIHWDISNYSHHQTIVQYAPFSQPGDWTTMHAWLREYAGVSAILMQVLQAHNLPNNEQGVYSHFLCVSGIDSTLGYFLINGDQVQASNQHLTYYPGTWCTVDQLIPANVAGMIVVQRDPDAPYV
jgi:hypothetical protein